MKKIDKRELIKEVPLYKHMMTGKVRFDEVDSFGVVHNIKYLYYLEWARTEYLKAIGMPVNHRTFTLELPLMVVHSEIDYINSLLFTSKYEVLSRISSVKKSSLVFENIIRNEDGDLIVKASAVMVYLNPDDYTPSLLPRELSDKIRMFEGDNVKFISDGK
jgi:YbgC/YbaW family acyl-CoA thioester hydrolase